MKFKLSFLFFIFSFGFSFAQDHLVGKFGSKESEFYYNPKLYQASDSVYLLGRDNYSILYLDPISKKSKVVFNCPQYYSIGAITATTNGLIFSVGRWSSDETKLYFLQNNGPVKEITFYYATEGLRGLSNHGGYFYYSVHEGNYYNLYRMNLSDHSLTFLYTNPNDMYCIGELDQGLVLSIVTETNQTILAIQNGVQIPIVTKPFAYPDDYPISISSNDSVFSYFSINYHDSIVEDYRIHKASGSFNLFSNARIKTLYFDSDSTAFIGSTYNSVSRASIQAGTISAVENLHPKAILSGNYESISGFDFPSKYFISRSDEFGYEIAKLGPQDSIELIQDLAPGPISSYPVLPCSNLNYGTYNIGFSDQGKHYASLSNLKNNFMYLYELQDNTLIPRFKLDDFSLSMNYFPSENGLVYTVYNDVLKQFSVYKRAWNDLDPEQIEASDSAKTWYTEMGMYTSESPCFEMAENKKIQDIQVDSDNNSYVGFMNAIGYSGLSDVLFMSERNADTSISIKALNFYMKYDPYGKLVWFNSIGDLYKSWAKYDQFIINKSGNLTVIGNYYKKGHFDDDSLTSLGSCVYMAHLNQTDGKVIYKKKLLESYFVNDFNISQIQQDSKGNIYLSFHYYNYKINLFDTVLISDWDKQHALIKLDSLGNFIWATNLLTSWDDYMGIVSSLKLDEQQNRIYAYCTQDGNYGCEEYGWLSEIFCFNLDGSLVSRKQHSGSAQSTNALLELLDADALLLRGSYNGLIHADEFTNQTEPSGDCYAYENFELIYHSNLNRIVKARSSENHSFFVPICSRNWNDTIYFLGVNSSYQLGLQRYDLQGNFTGQLMLNQFTSGSHLFNNHFDIRDGYITLVGHEYRYDGTFGVNPFNQQFDPVSVLRIENKNWNMGDQVTVPMAIGTFSEDSKFTIHPNPIEAVFEVDFNSGTESFSTYEITDIQGQVVQTGSCGDFSYLKFDFSNRESGIYLFTLFSDSGKYSKKMVKL